jgi:hypothetical protein
LKTEFAHALQEQLRANAAALPGLRTAYAACQKDPQVRRIARALHLRMPGMRGVAHDHIMTTAALIMLVSIIVAVGVAWHGHGRWYG